MVRHTLKIFSICCKIFKVCLTILGRYVLKVYTSLQNSSKYWNKDEHWSGMGYAEVQTNSTYFREQFP